MKFIKKASSILHSKTCTYLLFVFSVCAYIFVDSAQWAYNWIAQLYPLGDKFIPLMLGIICACTAVNFCYLLLRTFSGERADKIKGMKFINPLHTVFAVISIITFIYGLMLVFSLDSGISAAKLINGFSAISPKLIYLALSAGTGLVLVFCDNSKKALKATISCVVVCALIISMSCFSTASDSSNDSNTFAPLTFQSQNAAENASIVFETLKQGEKADAANMLADNNKFWSAESPNRMPAEGYDDANNSVAEIKLAQTSTINTAVIEELGNEAQYFRLQALVDGKWITV